MSINKEIKQQLRDIVRNTPIGLTVCPVWNATKLKAEYSEVLKEFFEISDTTGLLAAQLYVDYSDQRALELDDDLEPDVVRLSTYGIFKSLQGDGYLSDINDVECHNYPLSVTFIRTATLTEVEKARGLSFTTEDKADLAAIHNSLNQLEKLLNATRIEFERMATGGLKVQTTTPSYLSQ
jgi:hypothetical protein